MWFTALLSPDNVQSRPQPVVLPNPNVSVPNDSPAPANVPLMDPPMAAGVNRGNNTVYQRIQTIQLTPQKQQVFKQKYLSIKVSAH